MDTGARYVKYSQYLKALPIYEKAIAIDPENLEAYKNVGFIYSMMGNEGETNIAIKKVMALAPNDKEAYLFIGLLCESGRNHGAALKYYEKAIELDPKYIDAYVAIGSHYLVVRNIDKAEEYYRKAMQIDPQNINPYINMAKLYLDRAGLNSFKMIFELNALTPDYYKVIEYVNKAENIGNKTADDYVRMSWIYYSLNQLNKKSGYLNNAKEALGRAMEMDPNNIKAYLAMGDNYSFEGAIENALKYYDKAIEIEPDNIMSYFPRLEAYMRSGMNDLALDDCNKIRLLLDADQVSIDMLFYSCELGEKIREYSFALSLSSQWISALSARKVNEAITDVGRTGYRRASVGDTLGVLHRNRAELYEKIGLYSNAIKDYYYLAPEERTYSWYEGAGNCYINTGNYKAAIELFTQGLKLPLKVGVSGFKSLIDGGGAAQKSLLYIERGKGYLKTDNYARAIQDCNDAIKLDGNSNTAYYQRALAYSQMGNNKKATGDMIIAAKLGNKDAQEWLTKKGETW
jgi:tetratricopeptide (TPR) repeat protein